MSREQWKQKLHWESSHQWPPEWLSAPVQEHLDTAVEMHVMMVHHITSTALTAFASSDGFTRGVPVALPLALLV
jgi:hypothetical protein